MNLTLIIYLYFLMNFSFKISKQRQTKAWKFSLRFSSKPRWYSLVSTLSSRPDLYGCSSRFAPRYMSIYSTAYEPPTFLSYGHNEHLQLFLASNSSWRTPCDRLFDSLLSDKFCTQSSSPHYCAWALLHGVIWSNF